MIRPGDTVTILKGIQITRKTRDRVTCHSKNRHPITVKAIEGTKISWEGAGHYTYEVDLSDIPEHTGHWPIDPDWIQKCIEKHAQWLVNEREREDAIQDVWVRIAGVLNREDPAKTSKKSWLDGVIRHAFFDWLDVKGRDALDCKNREIREEDWVDASEPVGLGFLLDLDTEGTEHGRKVQKHIVRRMVQGWTAKEAGRELGISSQAAHKHLNKFRELLAS